MRKYVERLFRDIPPIVLFIRLIGIFVGSMRKLLVLTVLAWASIAAMADGRTEQVAQLGHFRDCDVCSEMVVLPAGKYMMGATKGEFEGQEKYSFMYNDETPRHEEYVKSFAIAKFDVTRRQFAIFAMETGFRGKGCEIFDGKTWITDANADWQNPGFRQTDNDPVVCVSWNDVQKYIAWLNSQLTKNKGIAYRLPTEAEWEYAARAGTVTAAYWGNNPPDQCEYENARDESARFLDPTIDHAPCTDGYIYTAPVGSFKPNPWGLFDMLGNAEQWVGDCVNFGYHSPPNLSASPDACKSRALRGTSWAGIPVSVRSASRSGMPANARVSNFGFRIARSIQH